MINNNYLKNLCGLIMVLVSLQANAQDIIVKTDKSEIKAKILEIEENTIKYKKFEFQDGPSYNINKSDVFMIIYKNGTRETFEVKPEESKPQQSTSAKPNPTTTVANTPNVVNTQSSLTKVNYSPSRLWVAFPGPGSFYFAGEVESGLVSNYINYGLALTASSFDSDYVSSFAYGFGLYTSGYLPVNKLTGNFEKQDKGLFPYLRLGASFSLIDVEFDGETSSSSSFDIAYALGADYRFSPTFGLSIILSEFNTFGFGINFNFK